MTGIAVSKVNIQVAGIAFDEPKAEAAPLRAAEGGITSRQFAFAGESMALFGLFCLAKRGLEKCNPPAGREGLFCP